MSRSNLFGRRIHIAGSVSMDEGVASEVNVRRAREVISALVAELVVLGANFVIPVDAEKTRGDGLPICFDWLVWEAVSAHIAARPSGVPGPFIVAVKHHKNEEQIPPAYADLWNAMRRSDLVEIESAAHWNMASKRMEGQARHGDVLVTLGGGEGVLYLANLYHDAGRPVVPLNFPLGPKDTGSLRLFSYGTSAAGAARLFQPAGNVPAQTLLNRIESHSKKLVDDEVRDIVALLNALDRPRAFVVRLLDPLHADFEAVENYFSDVVRPVLEDSLGYRMTVVDGNQAFDHARIDQDIFEKLHRSQLVVADITGARPNCFIELGYALGRALPTVLLARQDTQHPFDVATYAGLHWTATGTPADKQRALQNHWSAVRRRPAIVPTEPLIP